jgi:hypothetical protein
MGGLMIGFCVSYFLLRFFDKVPTKKPMVKSVILTFILLILVTILIGGPSSFLATGDVLSYFLISTVFNLLRFLALATGIGYGYQRLDKGFELSVNPSKSTQGDLCDRLNGGA